MQRIYIRNETLTTRGEARLPTRRRRLANRLAQLTLEAIGERLGSTLINETKRNETLYASTFDSGSWIGRERGGVHNRSKRKETAAPFVSKQKLSTARLFNSFQAVSTRQVQDRRRGQRPAFVRNAMHRCTGYQRRCGSGRTQRSFAAALVH